MQWCAWKRGPGPTAPAPLPPSRSGTACWRRSSRSPRSRTGGFRVWLLSCRRETGVSGESSGLERRELRPSRPFLPHPFLPHPSHPFLPHPFLPHPSHPFLPHPSHPFLPIPSIPSPSISSIPSPSIPSLSIPSIPSPSIPSPSIPSIQSSTSEAQRGFSLPDSFGADLGHVLIARPRRLLAAAIGKKGSVLGSCLEHRAWMRCRPFILGSGMCCRVQDVGQQPQAMAPNEINATQRSFNPSLPIVLDFPLPPRIGTQHCEQTPLSHNLEQKQILYFSLQSMGRGSAAASGSSCVCSHPRRSALWVFSSLWGFLPCNQRWRGEITAVLCSNGASDGGCRSALRRLQSKPSLRPEFRSRSPKRQRLLYGHI